VSEDFASIDELLSSAEEAPRRPPPAWLTRAWLPVNALLSLALAGIVYAFLRATGIGVPYVLVFTVIFATGLLRRALRAVQAPPLPDSVAGRFAAKTPDPHAADAELADRMYMSLTRWDTRLEWTEHDPGRFAQVVGTRLGDLADERLRLKHGISRAANPTEARQVMGELLWTFLHVPIRRNPTPRELADIVSKVEAL
jgi:hypothetical protein